MEYELIEKITESEVKRAEIQARKVIHQAIKDKNLPKDIEIHEKEWIFAGVKYKEIWINNEEYEQC